MSWVAELWAYGRERLWIPMQGVLGLFLGACVLGVGGLGQPLLWSGLALAAWGLGLAPRVMDDLADREWDRGLGRDRVLVRSSRVRAYGWFVLGLGASGACGLGLVVGPSAASGYTLLLGSLALVYRLMPRGRVPNIPRALLLHLKYPAFVLLLGDPAMPAVERALGASLAYAVTVLFEIFDEAKLRRSPVGVAAPGPRSSQGVALLLVLTQSWIQGGRP